MKKICLVISFIICLLCFAGCKDNTQTPDTQNPNQGQEMVTPGINEGTDVSGEVESEDVSGEIGTDAPSGDISVEIPDDTQPNDGEDIIPEEPTVDEPNVEDDTNNEEVEIPSAPLSGLAATVTNMVAKAKAEVNSPMTEAIPAEVSSGFVGLETEEFNTYVEDSIVYESMMGVFPESICIIKINDTSKVAELKQKVFDTANTRKWICVSAEKAVVVESGNYIMLAMGTETICDDLVTAFGEEMGGNLGEVLSKKGE